MDGHEPSCFHVPNLTLSTMPCGLPRFYHTSVHLSIHHLSIKHPPRPDVFSCASPGLTALGKPAPCFLMAKPDSPLHFEAGEDPLFYLPTWSPCHSSVR